MLTSALLMAILADAPGISYRPNDWPLPNAYASVALVAARRGDQLSCGTAWLLELGPTHSYWVTCSHVVGKDPAAAVTLVLYPDGQDSPPLAARVLYASPASPNPDVALLALPLTATIGIELHPIESDRPNEPAAGEIAIQIGCPKAAWPSMLIGRIQAADHATIRATPQPAEGRSGSPLLDRAGHVLGVITWRDPVTGTGIAQPWSMLRDHLASVPSARAAGSPIACAATATTAVPDRAKREELPYIVTITAADDAACPGPACPWPQRLIPPRQTWPPDTPGTPTPTPGAIPWPNLTPPPAPPEPPSSQVLPRRRADTTPSKDVLPQDQEPDMAKKKPSKPDPPKTKKSKRAIPKAADAAERIGEVLPTVSDNWRETNRHAGHFKWLAGVIAAIFACLKAIGLYNARKAPPCPDKAAPPSETSTTKS